MEVYSISLSAGPFRSLVPVVANGLTDGLYLFNTDNKA